MYHPYNVDFADFFDETTRFRRLLICIFLLNWRWLAYPLVSYETFLTEEIRFGRESLIRKLNKLEYMGLI
jgi:hypothetical protein